MQKNTAPDLRILNADGLPRFYLLLRRGLVAVGEEVRVLQELPESRVNPVLNAVPGPEIRNPFEARIR